MIFELIRRGISNLLKVIKMGYIGLKLRELNIEEIVV
jgi:hypothetical protein